VITLSPLVSMVLHAFLRRSTCSYVVRLHVRHAIYLWSRSIEGWAAPMIRRMMMKPTLLLLLREEGEGEGECMNT